MIKNSKLPYKSIVPAFSEEPVGLFIKEKNEEKWLAYDEVEQLFGVHLSNQILVDPNNENLIKDNKEIFKSLKNIFSGDNKNQYADKICLVSNKPYGWGVVARENIPITDLAVFSGLLGPMSDNQDSRSDYSIATKEVNKEKTALEVVPDKYGNFTRFMQCFVTEQELKDNYDLITIDEKQIATANIIIESCIVSSNHNSNNIISIAKTKKPIDKDEGMGWSYGMSYWIERNLKPQLFDKSHRLFSKKAYRCKTLDITFNLSSGIELECSLTKDDTLEKIKDWDAIQQPFFAESNESKERFFLNKMLLAKLAALQNVCLPEIDYSTPITKVSKKEDLGSQKITDIDLKFRTLAAEGDLAGLRELIENNKINDIDSIGSSSKRTALYNAVQKKNVSIVKYLLLHGASPFIADKDGNTPYDIADKNIRENIFDPGVFLYSIHVETKDIKKTNIPVNPGNGYKAWLEKQNIEKNDIRFNKIN